MQKIRNSLCHSIGCLIALLTTTVACVSRQQTEVVQPLPIYASPIEHSPTTIIVMYDQEVGKEPLLNAIKRLKAEIIYDYSLIPGMAIRKPDDKTLEETMELFRKVKGVVSVEYDRVYHLTDPVKPKTVIM